MRSDHAKYVEHRKEHAKKMYRQKKEKKAQKAQEAQKAQKAATGTVIDTVVSGDDTVGCKNTGDCDDVVAVAVDEKKGDTCTTNNINEVTRKDDLSTVFGINIIMIYVFEYLMIDQCDYKWHISDCRRMIYLNLENQLMLIQLNNVILSSAQHLSVISIIKPVVCIYINDTIYNRNNADNCWVQIDDRIQIAADTTKWYQKLSFLSETIHKCIHEFDLSGVNQIFV